MLRLNRPVNQTIICIAFLITLSGQTTAMQSEAVWVRDAYHKGDFKLADRTRVADIVVSAEDFRVVQIVAENLAADVERASLSIQVRGAPDHHLSNTAASSSMMRTSVFSHGPRRLLIRNSETLAQRRMRVSLNCYYV